MYQVLRNLYNVYESQVQKLFAIFVNFCFMHSRKGIMKLDLYKSIYIIYVIHVIHIIHRIHVIHVIHFIHVI